jgi:hypothetical protein
VAVWWNVAGVGAWKAPHPGREDDAGGARSGSSRSG